MEGIELMLRVHYYVHVHVVRRPLPLFYLGKWRHFSLLTYFMLSMRLLSFLSTKQYVQRGKREKVVLGYGGLECVHCIGQPGARKVGNHL